MHGSLGVGGRGRPLPPPQGGLQGPQKPTEYHTVTDSSDEEPRFPGPAPPRRIVPALPSSSHNLVHFKPIDLTKAGRPSHPPSSYGLPTSNAASSLPGATSSLPGVASSCPRAAPSYPPRPVYSTALGTALSRSLSVPGTPGSKLSEPNPSLSLGRTPVSVIQTLVTSHPGTASHPIGVERSMSYSGVPAQVHRLW